MIHKKFELKEYPELRGSEEEGGFFLCWTVRGFEDFWRFLRGNLDKPRPYSYITLDNYIHHTLKVDCSLAPCIAKAVRAKIHEIKPSEISISVLDTLIKNVAFDFISLEEGNGCK